MTDSNAMTFREFAARIGCRPSYITALRKAGRLVLAADGKRVLAAESIAQIEATRDPARAGVAARHAEVRGSTLGHAPAAIASEDGAADDPDGVVGTSDARRRAKALADKAEADAAAAIRENLKAEGKLYDAEDADHALESVVTALRKSLERIPVTIAPMIVGLADEARVRDILAVEIDRLQREMERELLAIGRASE